MADETADETVAVTLSEFPLKNTYATPNNAIAIKIPHTILIPMDCEPDVDAFGVDDDLDSSAVSSQSPTISYSAYSSSEPEPTPVTGPVLLFCKFVFMDCGTVTMWLATMALNGPAADMVSVNAA